MQDLKQTSKKQENTMETEILAGALDKSVRSMNKHINDNGQIQPSSDVIKNWHEYDNTIWKVILTASKILIDGGKMNVKGYVEADIDFLLQHIEKCADYTDNVLYPTQQETMRLPDAVTHVAKHRHGKTIKTRTFRTMMNIREGLNTALGIDLPNADGSKGGLDPTPFERLF